MRIKQISEIAENFSKDKNFFLLNKIRLNWGKIVGELIFKNTDILYLKDNILYILVPNSGFLQEMNLLKNYIISNINELIGEDYILDLNIRNKEEIKNYKAYFKKEKKEKINYEKIELTEQELDFILKKSLEIEDENIKEKILSIMINSKKREKYLLGVGYKKCKECGNIFFNEDRDICENCKINKEKERKVKIIKLIKENPFVKYLDLKMKIKDLEKKEYEDIKKHMKNKAYYNIIIAKKENNEEKMYENAVNLFILETGIANRKLINQKVNAFLKRFT